MAKVKYRVVVAGLGKRGMHHALAFQANPRFEVVGLCDIDVGRLREGSARLGVTETGADGFAEVMTGGGWRAVTRQGAVSGGGSMNYDLDMPPYIQQIADWLDDEAKPHPCRFESAFRGFEIMMAMCRSAAAGGQVALPLESGADEIAMLRAAVPQRKVLLGTAASAKEYGG